MEIDLQDGEAPARPVRSQVCIVGAGIAGLTLAHRLAAAGVGVTLLEAGGKAIDDAGQSLFAEALLDGSPHAGTNHGRFRVFGGTSLRWGGQLLRPAAVEPELEGYYAEAEGLLGVDRLPYAAADFFTTMHAVWPAVLDGLQEIEAQLSKWTPFARRNLAATLGKKLLAHPRVCVYLHAQATELVLAAAHTHLEAVMVRGRDGEAEQFVLAAGTVETVRLLLASRKVAPEGVGNAHGAVGQNFHDHLTLPAATIEGAARARLLRELRPWVVRRKGADATLHSIKLAAKPALREQLGLNAVIAHLALSEPEGTGLAAVRTMLLARQQGGFGKAVRENARHLPGALADAARLAWAAQMQGRRYVSAKTSVVLQFNAAQDAPSSSTIRLSSACDAYGEPLPIVDWRISANELRTLRAFARHLRERFKGMGLDGMAWKPELFREDVPLLELDDARHAMGGACMGADPRTSVVDERLSVHGVANLSVASPAVFASGEAQLPTLLLMALTLRLGDRLAAIV
jgi:choline dehydrogenase-like flavoprotein